MHLFTIWNRIEVGAARYTPGVYRSNNLVIPAISRAGDLALELSGLLPNRDHNGDLLAAIERMLRCLTGERPVFAVLAADPFLRVDLMSDRLAQKGYRQVVNLPSVGQYGAEFTPMLGDLDLGVQREFRVLTKFKARGFDIAATVAAERDIDAALALDPERLFVAPNFDFWHKDRLDPDRLTALCRATAEARDGCSSKVPIVLLVGRLPISATHARDAGANAILFD